MATNLLAIKGSRDGLRLVLDAAAPWDAVVQGLEAQLERGSAFFHGARITVELGERDIDDDELGQMLAVLRRHRIEAAGLASRSRSSRDTARSAGVAVRAMPRVPTGDRDDRSDAWLVRRTIRSGQVVRHHGNLTIVGDIKHSRVARSCMDVFVKLGARVTAVAPSTLLPAGGLPGGVAVAHGIDDVVGECDVLYMLRMQRERMDSALVPELGEYSARFGLDPARAARLPAHTLVMHPGPMNRGVEMLVDPSHLPGSRILAQVANGVSVRMAVLFSLLGGAAAGLERGDS